MKTTSRTDWARVDAMTDEEIDTSDIPPITEEMYAKSFVRYPSPVQITLSIDPVTAEWFESQGDSADKQMAEVLRTYVESHRV